MVGLTSTVLEISKLVGTDETERPVRSELTEIWNKKKGLLAVDPPLLGWDFWMDENMKLPKGAADILWWASSWRLKHPVNLLSSEF